MSELQKVQNLATQHGITLTANDYQKIAAAKQAKQKELQAAQSSGGFAEKFNRLYPEFLNFIQNAGNVVISTAQQIITALGVPVILVLLLIVEIQRVRHGIALFEHDHGLALLAAIVLVLANFVLEVVIHFVETSEGYNREKDTAYSLRTAYQNLRYFLGIGKHWQARELSPANEQRKVLRLVTFAILALALAGSMQTAMAGQSGVSWYQGIVAIATKSSLMEFSIWLGGLLFTFAAVRLAQVLTRYVALKAAQIIVGLQTSTADHSLDQIEADYILAKINKKRAKQELAPVAAGNNGNGHKEVSADFLAVAIPGQNGNGNHL